MTILNQENSVSLNISNFSIKYFYDSLDIAEMIPPPPRCVKTI